MKNIFYISITVLIITSIYSCNNKESRNDDTPESLENSSLDIKRYSKRGDLVNNLYYDLVENSEKLKKLDQEIIDFNENDIENTFIDYDEKSSSYYASANYNLKNISDTLLKNKIKALIEKSNEKYKANSSVHIDIIKTINFKQKSINEQYSIMKILLTLPIIEGYQAKNSPSLNDFKNFVKKEDSLLNEIKNINPKY